MKEHFRRSPAMSAKVCGRLWLLSRSWAASVRTSCWAAHWRCCEESLEDRQQAARALASSRGPTAEGLWEGWAYKCAIRPARHGTEGDKVARRVREGTKIKMTNIKRQKAQKNQKVTQVNRENHAGTSTDAKVYELCHYYMNYTNE